MTGARTFASPATSSVSAASSRTCKDGWATPLPSRRCSPSTARRFWSCRPWTGAGGSSAPRSSRAGLASGLDAARAVPACGLALSRGAAPQVDGVFHIGGDIDFDNFYRVLAPWKMLRRGKVVVMPATRRYRVGRSAGNTQRAARDHPPRAAAAAGVARSAGSLSRRTRPHAALHLVEKDVMVPADAIVNWDSGTLASMKCRTCSALSSTPHVATLSAWMCSATRRRPSLWPAPLGFSHDDPPAARHGAGGSEIRERANDLTLVAIVRRQVKSARQAG